MIRKSVLVAWLLFTPFLFAKKCEDLAELAPELSPAMAQEEALGVAPRFQAYFDAARSELKERDYIVDLSELALLSEEHLLLMGPPGNAKSMLADRILGFIKTSRGRPSYYRIQMTPETTQSETHGPLDYKSLTETNRYRRIYKEGMLLSRNVFIDEIFDARSNAMRNILGLLAERAHAQGPRIVKGKIETVIAATNKYINEVYERAGNDDPKAVLDRFAFSAFVPGELEDVQSGVDIIQRAKKSRGPIPELSFDELEKLRAVVKDVEIPDHVASFLIALSQRVKADTDTIEASELKKYREKVRNNEEAQQPYRATKFHSPRTMGKAGSVLKAIVVRDWLMKGGKRELKANEEDLEKLEQFFTLNGPNTPFLEQMLGRATPKEKAQIEAILQERQIFKTRYKELLEEMNGVVFHYALTDIQTELDSNPLQAEKEKLLQRMLANLIDVETKLDKTGKIASLDGTQLGLRYVHSYLEETLKQQLGETFREDIQKMIPPEPVAPAPAVSATPVAPAPALAAPASAPVDEESVLVPESYLVQSLVTNPGGGQEFRAEIRWRSVWKKRSELPSGTSLIHPVMAERLVTVKKLEIRNVTVDGVAKQVTVEVPQQTLERNSGMADSSIRLLLEKPDLTLADIKAKFPEWEKLQKLNVGEEEKLLQFIKAPTHGNLEAFLGEVWQSGPPTKTTQEDIKPWADALEFSVDIVNLLELPMSDFEKMQYMLLGAPGIWTPAFEAARPSMLRLLENVPDSTIDASLMIQAQTMPDVARFLKRRADRRNSDEQVPEQPRAAAAGSWNPAILQKPDLNVVELRGYFPGWAELQNFTGSEAEFIRFLKTPTSENLYAFGEAEWAQTSRTNLEAFRNGLALAVDAIDRLGISMDDAEKVKLLYEHVPFFVQESLSMCQPPILRLLENVPDPRIDSFFEARSNLFYTPEARAFVVRRKLKTPEFSFANLQSLYPNWAELQSVIPPTAQDSFMAFLRSPTPEGFNRVSQTSVVVNGSMPERMSKVYIATAEAVERLGLPMSEKSRIEMITNHPGFFSDPAYFVCQPALLKLVERVESTQADNFLEQSNRAQSPVVKEFLEKRKLAIRPAP